MLIYLFYGGQSKLPPSALSEDLWVVRNGPASRVVVQGGCPCWRPPFFAVPPCLLGGASPPPSTLPSTTQPLWGAPPALPVLLCIFVVGAAPRSYSSPFRSTYPLFVAVRVMPDLYHWPCKGQTLLTLFASQPCVAWGLIWVLSAAKCRRVGHFHS